MSKGENSGPHGATSLFISSSCRSSHLGSCLCSLYPSLLFSLSSQSPWLAPFLSACLPYPFSFSPPAAPFPLSVCLACSLERPHVRAPLPQVRARAAAPAHARGLSCCSSRAALHRCLSPQLSGAGFSSYLKISPSSSSASLSSSFSPHCVLFCFFSCCVWCLSLKDKGKVSTGV